jgi:hypothetical protein
LKRGRRCPRRLLAPQRVDEPVSRDGPARFEKQSRENCPLLVAAERNHPLAVDDLERSEDPEVEHEHQFVPPVTAGFTPR